MQPAERDRAVERDRCRRYHEAVAARIPARKQREVTNLYRKAASVLFPNGSPIGQRMQLGWQEFGGDGATVVGVVEHLQFEQGFGSPPELQAWVSIRQAARLSTGLMVRTQGDPQDLVPAIRSTLAELNSDIALTSVMTMEEPAKTVTARPRVVSMLLSIFAAVSLFLVAAGLYGTIPFTVARRTREIGLRASLGANRGSLLTLVLEQGLGVTVLGIVVGLGVSSWATRFLEGLVFEVGTVDPITLGGVTAN